MTNDPLQVLTELYEASIEGLDRKVGTWLENQRSIARSNFYLKAHDLFPALKEQMERCCLKETWPCRHGVVDDAIGQRILEERAEKAESEVQRLLDVVKGFVRAEEADLGIEKRGTIEKDKVFPMDRDGHQLWRFVGDIVDLGKALAESQEKE